MLLSSCMMRRQGRRYSPQETKERIARFCSMQEQSEFHVRRKLKDWQVPHQEIDALVDLLIDNNFLNEERFVRAYVSGKFRIKRWGKNKIVAGLAQLNLRGEQVQKAINELDAKEYFQTLEGLAKSKWALSREDDLRKRREKVARSLMAKGYESDLVWKVIPKEKP